MFKVIIIKYFIYKFMNINYTFLQYPLYIFNYQLVGHIIKINKTLYR